MNVYLASRYSRRLELCAYRGILHAEGHTVPAAWLNGEHQISDRGMPIGESGEALVEGDDGAATPEAAKLRTKFAVEDMKDVENCDCLIAFTEEPRSGSSRGGGGRHVELGIAIGLGKLVIICGPRENIFCWLPNVIHVDCFESAVSYLAQHTAKAA